MKKTFLIALIALFCLLLFGCAEHPSEADRTPIPVIIDCDPGVDDAIALCIANATDQLDVKAMTSVFGNATINRTTYNLLTLADYLAIDAVIATGQALPIGADGYGASGLIHGFNGLGDFVIEADFPTLDPRKAWDVIYDTAISENGKLQLIALGPLTNIATALDIHPDLPGFIDRIVIMGGSTTGGNQTDYAEFNIHCDPAAAQAVFASGIDIVMVGLDVTHQTYLSSVDVQNMMPENCKISYLFNGLSKQFAKIFPSNPGINLHDPLAVIYSFDPAVANGYRATVTVDISDGDRRGETTATADQEGNVFVLESVDNELVMAHVSDMFQYYSSDRFQSSTTTSPSTSTTSSDPVDLRIWQGTSNVYANDDGRMELSLCVETDNIIYFLFDEYYQALSVENYDQYSQIEHSVHVTQGDKEFDCSLTPSNYYFNDLDTPLTRLFYLIYSDVGFDPSESYTITIDQITIDGVTPSEVTDSYSVDANIPFNDAGKIHFIPLKNNLTLIRPDVFSGRYQYSNMIYSTFAYSADGIPLTIKPIMMIALDFELFQIENEDGLDWSRLELSQVELESGAATTDEAVSVDLQDEAKTVNLWGLNLPIKHVEWTEDGLEIQFEPMGLDLSVFARMGETVGIMDKDTNTLFFPGVANDGSIPVTFNFFTASSYQPIVVTR